MAYRRPQPYGSLKPPIGTPINWDNPITQGLVLAFAFNDGAGLTARNSVSHRYNASLGNSTSIYSWRSGKYGIALDCRSTTHAAVTLANAFVTGTTFTIAGGFTLTTSVAAYGTVFLDNASTVGLYLVAGTGFSYYFAGDHFVSSSPTVVGTHCDFVLSVNAGAGTFYLNGVQTGTVASVPSASLDVFGSDSFGDVLRCYYDYLYAWRRALRPTEIKALNYSPYGIFTPHTRRVTSAAAAAGGFQAAWARNANVLLQPWISG